MDLISYYWENHNLLIFFLNQNKKKTTTIQTNLVTIIFSRQRMLYRSHYLPWALDVGNNSKFIMNIYFEKRWDQQISDIYKEMNIKAFTGPKTKKIQKPKNSNN